MDIKQIPCEQVWPIRHMVMWPHKPIDHIKLPNDKKGIHYGLFVNDVLISVVSVFIDHKTAQFRKFATIKTEQSNGYGTKLLTHVLNILESHPITKIWCNARMEKAPFYEKFGLKKTDSEFSQDKIRFVIMEKLIS